MWELERSHELHFWNSKISLLLLITVERDADVTSL